MDNKPTVLITGATGYIGSHVTKLFYENGFYVTALDYDLYKNDISSYCHNLICADVTEIKKGQLDLEFDVVVHLAGLISVAESMHIPLDYYKTNLFGTVNVLENINYKKFIFASTAGCFDPISPYAKSKLAAEDVIRQVAKNYTIFRFFNVAGNNGLFKQFGDSTHLIRVAAEVAAGKREKLTIFGNDYTTLDGTCIRDYVHVQDLSKAILNAALDTSSNNLKYDCIGSDKTYTNLEVANIMREVSGNNFSIVFGPRRSGDPAILGLDTRSKYITPEYDIWDICKSAYEMEMKS